MAVPVLHRDTHHAHQAPDGEPMRELDQIQQHTFQLLQSMLGASPFAGVGTWVPAVDIEETEDSWILEAELPGAKRGDIDIEAHDNDIQITGEIVERERAGILRRRTRRVGRFEYRVTLPGPIYPDSINASLDDGILRMTVPKPEQARPRRVVIQTPPGNGGPAEPAVTT